jgi:hypothetical protein
VGGEGGGGEGVKGGEAVEGVCCVVREGEGGIVCVFFLSERSAGRGGW